MMWRTHCGAVWRLDTAAKKAMPERGGVILLGALASVYGKGDGGMDTAVWLGENKGEVVGKWPFVGVGQASVGHYMVEALREIGVLDKLVETSEGIIMYPKKFSHV